MSRNTMMVIFVVCVFCMSLSLTAESQPRDIVIASDTTIILNVGDAVNGTNLTFTGIIHEAPGTPEKNPVPNAGLNITWNGTYKGSTISDSDGYFSFSFPVNERAGDYILNVSFDGDEYHNASFNTTDVNVKHPVILSMTVSDSVTVIGNNVTVNGSIMDDDSSFLDSEILILKMNDEKVGSTLSLNGFFSFNYLLPLGTAAGNHTLVVEHPGSAYYTYNSTSKNITVKRTTKIILIPKTVARNISAEINGALLDNMDEPVPEAEVNIFWNKTPLDTTKTDEKGVFSFEYHINSSHPLGEVEVNAVFNGSDFYTSSQNTANYTVIRGAAIIMESKNVFRNSIVEISGTLVNDTGEGITGNVSIYWADAPDPIKDNLTTGPDGIFSYSYPVNANHSLGNVNVTVKFSGNDIYPSSEKTVSYTVMAHTNIIIFAKTLRRGEFVDINGTLIDDKGNGFQGLVAISWNNTGLDNVTADENGNFSLKHQVGYNHPLGTVRVDAVFNGSEMYGSSSNNSFYSIVSNTTIIMEPENVFRNTTIEIKGRIIDDQGAGIWNLTINITFDGDHTTPYSNDSNNSGFFSVAYNLSANHSLGNLTVIAVFEGSDIYVSSSAVINYSVFSNTIVTMFSKTVFKGGCAEINGSIFDDNEKPVIGVLNIYWDDEYKGSTASNDGFFLFHYNVSLNQSVGIIKVAAVFPETGFYLSSNNTVNYTVVANTTLTFSAGELVRGELFTIMGEMFENCSGQEGAPGAKHRVSIILNDMLIGNVFTETNGSFMFTDAVPTVSRLGIGMINVTFNGSLCLKPSSASANVTVKERITMMINAPVSVVENETFECEIMLSEKIFNLTVSVALQGEGQIKIDSREMSITKNNPYCFNLTTDKNGKGSFSVSVKFAGTLTINASFQGREYFTGAASNKTVFIFRKQVEEKPLWLYFLIIPVLCLPGLGYYVLRRRHLSKMRKIIVDARGELAAGSEYVRTILLLYKKLCDHLKKYGFIRKRFETFREFENGIRKGLPVDREHLNKFISIIEEVRYSSHEIGSGHRDEAVKNFTAVEQSLKNILGGKT
ncbi:MAG: hypothetical protein QMC80_06385 [Thermoplasmatales archaeon]|nr:hypothetical protein [Thermoplasmatales archaeon]